MCVRVLVFVVYQIVEARVNHNADIHKYIIYDQAKTHTLSPGQRINSSFIIYI